MAEFPSRARFCRPEAGQESDRLMAAQYLLKNAVYLVRSVRFGEHLTTLTLFGAGVADGEPVPFNAAMFEPVGGLPEGSGELALLRRLVSEIRSLAAGWLAEARDGEGPVGSGVLQSCAEEVSAVLSARPAPLPEPEPPAMVLNFHVEVAGPSVEALQESAALKGAEFYGSRPFRVQDISASPARHPTGQPQQWYKGRAYLRARVPGMVVVRDEVQELLSGLARTYRPDEAPPRERM